MNSKNILIIDTSGEDLILGLYKYRGESPEFYFKKIKGRAQIIIKHIDKFLREKKVTLKDLSGIVIKKGYGSYTGLRVGLSIANALAWSRNIPIFGYIEKENVPPSETKTKLLLAKVRRQKKFTKPVFPVYSS